MREELLTALRTSLSNKEFIKMTLSKSEQDDLKNVYVRLIQIKKVDKLSFTFRYKTNDQVKNFSLADGLVEIEKILDEVFKIATLFTSRNDFAFQINKKGKISFQTTKATLSFVDVLSHDKEKKKRAESGDLYLHLLGVTTKSGEVIPKMADKYRQINKYLEVIESLIKETDLPETVNIVDMGSGKGYLTFALYDYLVKKGFQVNVIGIELRAELVEFCNEAAEQCSFSGLRFENKPIEEFTDTRIDILIALHACDTATDDAISKGIISDSTLIICAPCCHKQIRKQTKGIEQTSPLLKYGIFKERQFEMVTDTIRALILEKNHYQTKIFEFVSNEHTRKNVLLVGSKSANKIDKIVIDSKIDALKEEYGIEYHYLEKVVK
jgi:tRNA A58 N-methylase Trm61